MTEISQLPEVTSLADDDLLVAVDISDTTNNPTGETVKIQKSNAVSGGGGGKTLIEAITDPVGGTFLFSAIPGTYNRLRILGWVRSDSVSAAQSEMICTMNGDTTDTNYYYQYIQGSTSASTPRGASRNIGFISRNGGPTGNMTTVDITIENYADSATRTSMRNDFVCDRTQDNPLLGLASLIADTAAALTSLEFGDITGTDNLLGTLRLYGEM